MGTGSITRTLLRITRRGRIWRQGSYSLTSSFTPHTAGPVRANKGDKWRSSVVPSWLWTTSWVTGFWNQGRSLVIVKAQGITYAGQIYREVE